MSIKPDDNTLDFPDREGEFSEQSIQGVMSNSDRAIDRSGEASSAIKTDQEQKSRRIGRKLQQLGLNMLAVGLMAVVAYLTWERFSPLEENQPNLSSSVEQSVSSESSAANESSKLPATNLMSFQAPVSFTSEGVIRMADLQTIIPSRPRVDVITYTVNSGDTLFSIADTFGVKPEVLLWGNYEVLEDNPHLLSPNQVLNILPVNGIYYQWKEGDELNAVAGQFQADPQEIINFSGNHLDLVDVQEGNINIEPGTWVVIPGGKRPIKDWGPPAISRSNPASARYYGEGHCGDVYEGAFGNGTFVWPTTERSVVGYSFVEGVHPAIDIGGAEGNPVYATDSGVVVYAGWSNYGYGYLIVIDHGTGWQSAYAHLSAVGVSCGMSVFQGGHIGALGNTGNSSGPHLHFELAYNGAKVNPLDYLQ